MQGPEETQLWPLVVQCRMTQADFTEEAALNLLSTYHVLGSGMRRSIPGAENSPSQGRQAVVWTEVQRWETLWRLQVRKRGSAWKSHDPRGRSSRAAPEFPPPAWRFGRVSRAETGAAPGSGRRGRGLAARRRLRSFCSARVCVGSCLRRAAGRDERAFCLRPSGPARLSFLI